MLIECKLTGLMYDPDIEFQKILEKPSVKRIFSRLRDFDYELLRSKSRKDIIEELNAVDPRDDYELMDADELMDLYYFMVEYLDIKGGTKLMLK